MNLGELASFHNAEIYTAREKSRFIDIHKGGQIYNHKETLEGNDVFEFNKFISDVIDTMIMSDDTKVGTDAQKELFKLYVQYDKTETRPVKPSISNVSTEETSTTKASRGVSSMYNSEDKAREYLNFIVCEQLDEYLSTVVDGSSVGIKF